MPTMEWCELGTSMAMSPVPAVAFSCCSGNETFFCSKKMPGAHQNHLLAPAHSCPAEANPALGWGRLPGATYIVQVGKFDFQRGEERPRQWLHSHRDDFGVENGAVPGEERAKRGFRRIFVNPTATITGGARCALKVDPIFIKYPQRYLLLLSPHPLGSPHSQSLQNQTIYEPFQPLKQLGLESVSIPEIKYSWAHFLSLPRGNRAHLDPCRSLPTQNIP